MATVRQRVWKTTEPTWQVLYRHGGKQASRTYTNRKDAERLKGLIDLLGPDAGLKAAAGDQEQDSRITVAELWERFMEWKSRPVDKGGLTPRTRQDYWRDYRNYIEPWFAHRAAESIDEIEVQAWVDHMSKTLGPKTVADRHSLLHQMYDYGKARTRRLVTHSPCKETELPKRLKRKPPKGTTTPEFRAVLSAAEKRNPDAADLILFMGETGWRFSEATALDVCDIEDDGTDVWINMSRVFRIDENYRQYIAEDEAKSEAGFRRIKMFPATRDMLRRRISGKAAGEFVFLNSLGNHWNQNTFLRETWPKLLADSGVVTPKRKPTPHWLRHMHVAVCLAAGAKPHEVQRRIGHEHFSTTMDVYGGIIGDITDDAIVRATALMSGQQTANGVAPRVVRGEVVESVVGELE